MPLVLEQTFPLGRFHATRWNQSPFEDPHGEWPPSPWRLLRALTARWFQYSREVGDQAEDTRNGLLTKLARELPSFVLPGDTWRGIAIRQYHPLGLEKKYETETRPGSNTPSKYSFVQVGTTLSQDHYRAVPTHHPILWVWETIELSSSESALLHQLLRRVLYFGRAESYCRFRLLNNDPGSC